MKINAKIVQTFLMHSLVPAKSDIVQRHTQKPVEMELFGKIVKRFLCISLTFIITLHDPIF